MMALLSGQSFNPEEELFQRNELAAGETAVAG